MAMLQKQKKVKFKDEDEKQENNDPPDLGDSVSQTSSENQEQINNHRYPDLNFKIGQGNLTQSQQIQTQQLDVILCDDKEGGNKMMFKGIEAQIDITNEQNKLVILSHLLSQIKNWDFKEKIIFYFDTIKDAYVYCGKYPLQASIGIPHICIVSNQIQIKVRNQQQNIVDLLLEEQKQKDRDNETEEQRTANGANNAQSKKVKERKIGEVVEKVALWRKFYTGFYDYKSQFIHMSLDDAANKVQISKKTLDDYLLQIRCGKKYGFDFNKNINQRIGILRSFVKKMKDQEQESKKDSGNNNTNLPSIAQNGQ